MPPRKALSYQEEISALRNPKRSLLKHLDAPEVQAWRFMMDAYKAAYNFLDTKLQEDGYNCSRFQIFFLLYFEGPHTATQLAKTLQVTRGNMSMFLKRLLEEGLIKTHRFKSHDAPKGLHYYLSKTGQSDFERIFPKHVARIEKNFPSANPTTIRFFNSLMGLGNKIPRG